MKLSRLIPPLAVLAGLAVSLSAQTTVVNDDFTSTEDRQLGALSSTRANWYVLSNNTTTQAQTVVTGGSNGTPLSINGSAIAGSSNAYMAKWTPATLGVGDTLTVSLTFSFQRLPATGGLRFGIFDSTPGGVITSDVASVGQASFTGDTGYAWTGNSSMNIGTAPSGNVFRIGERTTLTATNLFSTSGDFTPLQAGNGTNAAWALNTSYTMEMSFYLAAADALHINAVLSGGAFGSGIAALEAVDSTPTATSFDYLLFRSATGNLWDVIFTELSVIQIAAIPEPSTYAAIFGIGALGLALWRRRRAA